MCNNISIEKKSVNSNSKVMRERCSRLIKMTLVRRNSIVVVHFVRFAQTGKVSKT